MTPRQLLVHVIVRRQRSGVALQSQRFVPASEFGLWQYAMANRHGLEVQQASIGVWLPNSEWERHEALFKGGTQSVDRIDVSVFDELLGVCHLIRRFAHRDDCPALNHRLAQHLGPGDFRPEMTEGVYAGARAVDDLRRLSRPMSALADEFLQVAPVTT